MPYTATITASSQNQTGDLNVSVQYSNGTITINESYPAEANGSTILATISARITQLQAAEDFVISNPPGTTISATPTSTPIQVDPVPVITPNIPALT